MKDTNSRVNFIKAGVLKTVKLFLILAILKKEVSTIVTERHIKLELINLKKVEKLNMLTEKKFRDQVLNRKKVVAELELILGF